MTRPKVAQTSVCDPRRPKTSSTSVRSPTVRQGISRGEPSLTVGLLTLRVTNGQPKSLKLRTRHLTLRTFFRDHRKIDIEFERREAQLAARNLSHKKP
jgi:hypothetical protein